MTDYGQYILSLLEEV